MRMKCLGFWLLNFAGRFSEILHVTADLTDLWRSVICLQNLSKTLVYQISLLVVDAEKTLKCLTLEEDCT